MPREAGRLDVERRPDEILLGLIEPLSAYRGKGDEVTVWMRIEVYR